MVYYATDNARVFRGEEAQSSEYPIVSGAVARKATLRMHMGSTVRDAGPADSDACCATAR